MADIRSLHNVNNELRNVLCMIANPFDRFRDEQIIEARGNHARIFHHVRDQLAHERAEFFVNGFVVADDLSG